MNKHDVIGHEMVKEDNSPLRMEIQQSMEADVNKDYIYDFGNENNKIKSVCCVLTRTTRHISVINRIQYKLFFSHKIC